MKRNNSELWTFQEKRETESTFKTMMAEIFLNLGREIDIQTDGSIKDTEQLNINRVTPGHNRAGPQYLAGFTSKDI